MTGALVSLTLVQPTPVSLTLVQPIPSEINSFMHLSKAVKTRRLLTFFPVSWELHVVVEAGPQLGSPFCWDKRNNSKFRIPPGLVAFGRTCVAVLGEYESSLRGICRVPTFL